MRPLQTLKSNLKSTNDGKQRTPILTIWQKLGRKKPFDKDIIIQATINLHT